MIFNINHKHYQKYINLHKPEATMNQIHVITEKQKLKNLKIGKKVKSAIREFILPMFISSLVNKLIYVNKK